MSGRSSAAGSRAGSKPASPGPASRRGSGAAAAGQLPQEQKYDPEGAAGASATASRSSSRPTSAIGGKKAVLSRPPSSSPLSAVGPVKAVYRPGSSTANAAAAAPAPVAATASVPRVQPVQIGAAAARAPAASSSSSSSTLGAKLVRRRLPNLPPDDSDYDSEEVVSEEELDDEQPLVHVPAVPLPKGLVLTRPDPRHIDDPDQRAPDDHEEKQQQRRAHELPLHLKDQHIVSPAAAPGAGGDLLPVTEVALEHQDVLVQHNGRIVAEQHAKALAAAVAAKSGDEAGAAAGQQQDAPPPRSSFNVMSFSSGPDAAQANDLLYTDSHAPYTFSRASKPLTIWLLGKPLSGKNVLAKRLQQELANNGATVLPNGGAPSSSTSSSESSSEDGGSEFRSSPPYRPPNKEYAEQGIPILSIEFLLSHARESSATPNSNTKFPGIETLVAQVLEGGAVTPDTLFRLFVFALHSERVAYHGYILPDLPFLSGPGAVSVQDLAALGSAYPALVERGVWPPQHVVSLELSDEEVARRLETLKNDYLLRRLGDAAGFREEKQPSPQEALAARLLALEEAAAGPNAGGGAGGDGGAQEDAPPSAPTGLTGGMGGHNSAPSRPMSAMSRSDSEGGGLGGRGGGSESRKDAARDYAGFHALHRPSDLEDWSAEEYESLWNANFAPVSSASDALCHRFLRLDDPEVLAQELLAYEQVRAQLRSLVASWSQFHPEPSDNNNSNSSSNNIKELTLASAQRLVSIQAGQSLTDVLKLVLASLGQSKWGSTGLVLAQHLPFVAKEELRPIEEDEVREILLLPNLHNSNKEVGSSSSGAPFNIPEPKTNDPSGLDLDSERLFEHVSHRFGVFQTYCPVSLLLEHRLVEGLESCAATFQGLVYLMSSPTTLRLFQENPLKYVSNPPALPGSFVLSIVGGAATGKTTLANLLHERFGWQVHHLDGASGNVEANLARVASLVALGGQHVLDGGPSTLAGLEAAQSAGLRLDRVAYVYVDDVEVLPGRLRLARKVALDNQGPKSEEELAREAAQAAAAAAAAAERDAKAAKKAAKKGGNASSAASAAAASSELGEDETTPEEEELMDRVDEFQNETWPNVLLPWLEEHAIMASEINNSTIVATPPPTHSRTVSTSGSVAATTAPTPTPFATAASSSGDEVGSAASASTPPGTLPAAVLSAIDATFLSLRRSVDPFFNWRYVVRAQRLSRDMVERSLAREDRVPLGVHTSASAAAAAAAGQQAAASGGSISGGRGGGAGDGRSGNVSAAVSVAGGASGTGGAGSGENPRLLRFQDTTFCPVCLLGDQRLLVPGSQHEGVRLGMHAYSCCSSSCAQRFVEDPLRFHIHTAEALANLAPSMPSLRILVAGGRASGKSSAAKALQKHFQLAYSFSLGELFYPALKKLAASTLALVLQAEAEEAARRAAEKEARKLARKARREAEAAERLARGEVDPSDEDGEDGGAGRDGGDRDSDSGSDFDDEDDGRDGTGSQSGSASVAGDLGGPSDLKDKDLLRLYISTPPSLIHEHSAILNELLEEEWFTHAQIEQLLRDIFAAHAWVDLNAAAPRDYSNAAGWVCESDLHNSYLLSRLENVLRDPRPEHHFAKPHVVLPMECATKTAVNRLVAREQQRRAQAQAEAEAAAKSGTGSGGADGQSSEEALAQSNMLKSLSEKHRLKQEAAEKAARELKEREEAAAAAKAAKPKRFGKDKLSAADKKAKEKEDKKAGKKSKKGDAAAAAAAAAAEEEENKQKEEEAASAAAADAKAAESAAADASAVGADAASSPSNAASSGGAAAGGAGGSSEKSEEQLALEAEAEEKRLVAQRLLEELTSIMSDLLRGSLESCEGFLTSLRSVHRDRGGAFVVLEAANSTSAPRLGPEAFLARKLLANSFASFLQAQNALFEPAGVVELSMNDSNKLLRNGMRTLRRFGSFCPCCLLRPESEGGPVAYDCKVSLSNSGGLDYFPLLWQNNVVLTCSRAHARLFARNARKYLLAPPPPPLVGHRVVVLESPGVGLDAEGGSAAAALARKVALALNAVHLSIEGILERAAAPNNPLALGARVREALADGELLSDALLVQCVAHAVASHNARVRGWVLEGFPQTLAQARLLKVAGVVSTDVLIVHDNTSSSSSSSELLGVGSVKQASRDALVARMISVSEETSAMPDPEVVAAVLMEREMEREQKQQEQLMREQELADREAAGSDSDDEDAVSSSRSRGLGSPLAGAAEDDSPAAAPAVVRRRGASSLLPPALSLLNLEEFVVSVPRSSFASAEAAEAEMVAARAQRDEVAEFFEKNYHNVTHLYTGEAPGAAGEATPNAGLRSTWQQSERALAVLASGKTLRQEYLSATHSAIFSTSRPGRIHGLGITRPTLLAYASPFGDLCPVCWVRDGLLQTSPSVRADRFTTEYRQRFYRNCSAEHQDLFDADPEAFLLRNDDAATQLPKEMPFVVARAEAALLGSEHCELNGFCPVTIRQSALNGAMGGPQVLPGSSEHTVCYRKRLYRLRGPREQAAFLSLPSVYSAVRLPQKMPPGSAAVVPTSPSRPSSASSSASPRKPSSGVGSGARGALALAKQDSRDLLVLGKTLAFMEVEFSALLMRALASFEDALDKPLDAHGASNPPLDVDAALSGTNGNGQTKHLRLKFPALPLSSSALLYLSLWLKVHNPRNAPHIRDKYQRSLHTFVEQCKLIPRVAQQYKQQPQTHQQPSTNKVEEESKEQPSESPDSDATAVNGKVATDPADAEDPAYAEASRQYDTLRAQLRAFQAGTGSKRDLAHFFERYLR